MKRVCFTWNVGRWRVSDVEMKPREIVGGVLVAIGLVAALVALVMVFVATWLIPAPVPVRVLLEAVWVVALCGGAVWVMLRT